MFASAALTALLFATAAAPSAAAPSAASAEPAPAPASAKGPSVKEPRTLWLVQPLYPGQDALIARTEQALSSLFPADQRHREMVGRNELAKTELDTAPALACVFGDTQCDDPMGALLQGWNLERVVLIKAGQDAKGYRFRAASFSPGSFDSALAENAGPTLEQALLGALLKVVPLASALEIETDPPGATVLVDGERVGVTPLNTQILPGERKIRIEMGFHEPAEVVEVVPVRGRVQLQRKLVQLPAQLKIVSPGAVIFVDGKEQGSDEVELGVSAGAHAVELRREGYHPHKQQISLEPGQSKTVEHLLEATGWENFRQLMRDGEEDVYSRKSWFSLSYDSISFNGKGAAGTSLNAGDMKPDAFSRAPSVWGVSVEHGVWFMPYFGLSTFGATFFQTGDDVILGIEDPGTYAPTAKTGLMGGTIRAAQPTLRYAIWKAVLGVQAGLNGRVLHLSTDDEGYDKGFLLLDFGAEVQGSLRIHPVAGLFLEGAYRHSFVIEGATDGTSEIRLGVGYAY